MVGDILLSLGEATWDTQRARPGVRRQKSAGQETIARTVESVRNELHDALSIIHQPAVELALTRPGEKGIIGASRLTYTEALPENHIVGWWATHRSRMLQRATTEIEALLADRRRELGRIDRSLAESRGKSVSEAILEGERMLEVVKDLHGRVAHHGRPELPDLRVIGPAMTRDPRRQRLLAALRCTVDVPTIEATLLLSQFREQTFTYLFEIWGAVAIARVLQSLHWQLGVAPHVRWIDTWGPERIVWCFSLDGERLELIYEPHAERRPLAPQRAEGPYLDRLQLAAALMDGSGEARLIAVNAAASPDYALVLHSRQGVAFTVGDAVGCDFEHGKREGKWPSVTDKLAKMANDYARSIAWWSPHHITSCSVPASFVLVPGHEERWRAEPAIAEEVANRGVLLLGALPRDPQLGAPIHPAHIDGILQTLRAHARDESRRMPHVPGEILSG